MSNIFCYNDIRKKVKLKYAHRKFNRIQNIFQNI